MSFPFPKLMCRALVSVIVFSHPLFLFRFDCFSYVLCFLSSFSHDIDVNSRPMELALAMLRDLAQMEERSMVRIVVRFLSVFCSWQSPCEVSSSALLWCPALDIRNLH